MPRHTHPRPELRPELESAAVAFGSRESLAILALLGAAAPGDPGLGVPEISDELGMAANTVLRHLRALEGIGLVRASQPPGSRRGKIVAFTIDRAAVRSCLDSARRIITPTPGRQRGR